MTAALTTRALSFRWGAFTAVRDVSFVLEAGMRHAIIGPNGAGKTTFVNLLTGVLTPSVGDVLFGGEVITRLPQHERVKRGLARTFQITTLFPGLTVLESIVLAICERCGMGSVVRRTVAQHTREIEEARELLASLRLDTEADAPTRTLSYGKQRLLEIALALATRPRVLLLDEPAAGIPVGEGREVLTAIAQLPREVTVLFIEHDMSLVFRFAERITVMVAGSILTEGSPPEIAADRRVREVYLGEGEHV